MMNRILTFLLWPVVLLERTLLSDTDKSKYGVLTAREAFVAQIERWGLLAIGVFSGVFGLWLIGGVVTLGFLFAGFVDPFIWARRKGIQVVEIGKKDFGIGIIVNLAIIWLFWLGFLVGGGLGAV